MRMPAFIMGAAIAAGLILPSIGWDAVAGTDTLEERQTQKAPRYGEDVRKEDREREEAEQFLVMSRRGLATHERFLHSIEQEMRSWKNNLSGDASEELKAYSKTMLRDAEATLKEGRELHEKERQSQEKLEADFKRRFHIDDEE
jgi:signal transduction histidine kinase